jgi:hypothetical protein
MPITTKRKTDARNAVWSTIRNRIKTGRGDRCSFCDTLFLDGDIAVGGTAANGRVHYTCTGCVHELQVIDGVGVVTWPVRGRS